MQIEVIVYTFLSEYYTLYSILLRKDNRCGNNDRVISATFPIVLNIKYFTLLYNIRDSNKCSSLISSYTVGYIILNPVSVENYSSKVWAYNFPANFLKEI